jgi:hypothetical protein
MDVVMRPPEVFARSLSHQDAVRLKRMSTRAEHQSTRIRAAILLASNLKTSVPKIARMYLRDARRVTHRRRSDARHVDGGRRCAAQIGRLH